MNLRISSTGCSPHVDSEKKTEPLNGYFYLKSLGRAYCISYIHWYICLCISWTTSWTKKQLIVSKNTDVLSVITATLDGYSWNSVAETVLTHQIRFLKENRVDVSRLVGAIEEVCREFTWQGSFLKLPVIRVVLGIDTFFRYQYFSIPVFDTKVRYWYFWYWYFYLTMIPILKNRYFSIPSFDTNLSYRYLTLYFSIPLNLFKHSKDNFFMANY